MFSVCLWPSSELSSSKRSLSFFALPYSWSRSALFFSSFTTLHEIKPFLLLTWGKQWVSHLGENRRPVLARAHRTSSGQSHSRGTCSMSAAKLMRLENFQYSLLCLSCCCSIMRFGCLRGGSCYYWFEDELRSTAPRCSEVPRGIHQILISRSSSGLLLQ